MTRLGLADSVQDVIFKMSEGNPEGLAVCAEMFAKGSEIDLDSALGGLGSVLQLDTLGIYGSNIWLLFKDVCGQSLPTTIAVLRAYQLGFISEDDIWGAIRAAETGQPIILDVFTAVSQVKKRLPSFRLVEEECHEDA